MRSTFHDPTLDAYLADVAGRLSTVPRAQREDVLAGLRDHITALADQGATAEDIITRLGSPEEVADAAASELPPRPPRFFDAKRLVQLVAVALAARASWTILFEPLYEGWQAWERSDGTSGEEITHQTMAQVNGWPLTLTVAALPLLLTLAPAVVRGRARQSVTVVCTVLLAGVAVLTGFSVGALYLLALVAAVCACLVPPTRHDPRHAIAGVLAGAGLVASWLAWNNRLGPGEVCQGNPPTSCHEYFDPFPFLTAAVISFLLVLGLELWARLKPRAS